MLGYTHVLIQRIELGLANGARVGILRLWVNGRNQARLSLDEVIIPVVAGGFEL